MTRVARRYFSSAKIFRGSAHSKRAARPTLSSRSMTRLRSVAWQGTAAIELLEEVDVDLVICPIGGGGLLCGTAVAAKSMRPTIKVIAAEPANADDAAQSFHAKKRIVTEKKFTIADGLRTNVGERNFPIIQRYVDDVVTVGEDAIISAMRTIWETMKIVIEPSAAVPYATMVEGEIDISAKGAGIMLRGGKADLDALPWTVRPRLMNSAPAHCFCAEIFAAI